MFLPAFVAYIVIAVATDRHLLALFVASAVWALSIPDNE